MLVNRADGRSDGDDALLHRPALAPANVVERVVSDGTVHGIEVDAVDDVAVFLEVRAHLVIEGAFAIEHNVGPLTLQQVRLDVIARFPAARRPEHENVVVQPASPCIAADGSVGGKQGFSLVGSSLWIAGRLAFDFRGRESLRKLIARGVFGDGFEFGGFHRLLLKLEVGDRWGIDGREKRTGEGGEGDDRAASSLSPLIARAGSISRHAPLQRVYHAIGEMRRHRIFRLEVGVSGGYLEDLLEVHSRMLGNDLRRYIANAHQVVGARLH